MATMEDIARRLGISKSTVCKALNDAADVSSATREAVYQVAREVGYIQISPSDAGKIALFLENMAYTSPNDYVWSIIAGFRQMAESSGYQIDVIPLDPLMQAQVMYDAYMQERGYAGALFLGLAPGDPWLQDFQVCRYPAVVWDIPVPGNPRVAQLGGDNEEAMHQVVTCLQKLGHKKIGYLSGDLNSYVNQIRYFSFFRALRKCALPSNSRLAGRSNHTSECIDKHLPRLLEEGVTAIICSQDLLAHAVMIHCQELGLQVPQDVSIVGFDDSPFCAYTVPPLASVRVDRMQLGRSGFLTLKALMDGFPLGSVLLHTELVRRKSMGRYPNKDKITFQETQFATVEEDPAAATEAQLQFEV